MAEAARILARTGVSREVLDLIMAEMAEDAAKNKVLDSPGGVFNDEAKNIWWYHGVQDNDIFWPALRQRLLAGSLANVTDEIDIASHKVVTHLACPRVHNLKKRGLVVGYVQSGKTANYTAVMAKAADAGYRFFIVLSGLHNNLRRQTQIRVSKDLGASEWHNWTTPDEDFGVVTGGEAIITSSVPSLAVVKKNRVRLESLRDWLRAIPVSIRERTPILLLDDEADQATPSTVKEYEAKRGINKLVREIWQEIKTGSYVGYTATPFANVFMDPDDEDELYPADFIIDLPRPDAYYGAERVFGREALHEDDDPDPGLDMIRYIPDTDGDSLRPPSQKEEREDFDPELPPSLVEAIGWFLVATAIRHARGQSDHHSSMLVHTTHYVAPHFFTKDRIDDLLGEMRAEVSTGNYSRFERIFDTESPRVAMEASLPLPSWDAVQIEIGAVVESCRVVVDNGCSEDRLDYNRENEDGPVTETVIAVGGGTLSRGLTLEGLVVSYFTRTSNTYDTLLQMGRWFGYRPGYEDLPRIWVQKGLAEEFSFLALVEEEIRQEMRDLERMKVTPKQMGVRVRAHPGRLSIVSRNKMGPATKVRVTYSGQRLQTFVFDEANSPVTATGCGVLDHNLELARSFIRSLRDSIPPERVGNARWMLPGIPGPSIIGLLEAFYFHPDQKNIRKDEMLGWLKHSAPDQPWNVIVIGSGQQSKTKDGRPVLHDPVDLGLDELVPSINRAPLVEPSASSGTANIKALMSYADWFADLNHTEVHAIRDSDAKAGPKEIRRALAGGCGVLAIYPVSRTSIPLGVAEGMGSRRAMEAAQDLIGLGLVFPDVTQSGIAAEGDYYAVNPKWDDSAILEDEDDDEPVDTEGRAPAPELLKDAQ